MEEADCIMEHIHIYLERCRAVSTHHFPATPKQTVITLTTHAAQPLIPDVPENKRGMGLQSSPFTKHRVQNLKGVNHRAVAPSINEETSEDETHIAEGSWLLNRGDRAYAVSNAAVREVPENYQPYYAAVSDDLWVQSREVPINGVATLEISHSTCSDLFFYPGGLFPYCPYIADQRLNMLSQEVEPGGTQHGGFSLLKALGGIKSGIG